MTSSIPQTRLGRLAQRSTERAEAVAERCELCSAPIAPEHRHVLKLPDREILCACRACATLFDRDAAGGDHFRLIPDRRLAVRDFELSDLAWEELRLPVDIAFFFRDSAVGRVVALYPGPMGVTESLLRLEAWAEIERANPVLESLRPDVEALLVDRALGARRHWIVPIDECYRLAGLIRMRWRGLTGGKEVWQAINEFFDELDRRAKPVGRDDR
jgi:Family of unknown function (DUF5947)